eukprot:4896900-Prymnesium_polylepis.1
MYGVCEALDTCSGGGMRRGEGGEAAYWWRGAAVLGRAESSENGVGQRIGLEEDGVGREVHRAPSRDAFRFCMYVEGVALTERGRRMAGGGPLVLRVAHSEGTWTRPQYRIGTGVLGSRTLRSAQ